MGNVITNDRLTLLTNLQKSFKQATEIKLVVSFVMESGVRLLLPELIEALKRDASIQILTSRYLNITEPSALYLLKDQLKNKADIRIYESGNIAFHPKTYIFIGGDEGEVFVGSSNLSRSGLVEGIEWNYRLLAKRDPEDYQKFIYNFDLLFSQGQPITDKWLKEYSLSWKRPRWFGVSRDAPKNEDEPTQPRGAQIEALHYLEQSRLEGFKRGMVVMATGVGKTYLAAFDSQKFRRVLFVAHREEILHQAKETFDSVVPTKTKGYFNAEEKCTDADIVFASVRTLSQEQYLAPSYFAPDFFDYIVIDEFHHVATQSYQRIVKYFKPKFMLGLTATPYRMDNLDIFQFCEDNVVYEINLQEAINKDYLVPFHYYGIYDETDYSRIDISNGRYVADQLERTLSNESRADLVINQYRKYKSERALAFCCGIKHANYMAMKFQENNIPAVAVHSGQGQFVMERKTAIKALRNREVEVIISVDQFNEGVDIPEVDLVMFLRPTESYTVFLQQLGRGLRKTENKEFLTVLDFIGNYKCAHFIPLVLTGQNPHVDGPSVFKPSDLHQFVAEGCSLNFDMRLLDLFEEMRKYDPLPERMKADYYRLKADLGKRPLRLDILSGSDISPSEFLKPRHLRPFKGYLRLLADLDELSPEEEGWLDTDIEKFLLELENTSMTKLYKVATIKSFIRQNEILPFVSSLEIGRTMQQFYQDPRFKLDMQDKSCRNFKEWSLDEWRRLAEKNPIHFLNKSSSFFQYDEINKNLHLASAIVEKQSPGLIEHINDILSYRERQKVARLYKKDRSEGGKLPWPIMISWFAIEYLK